MTQLTPRQLKSESSRLLQGRDTKKLVLLHIGAMVLLTLVASAINLYLDAQISGTSGLSGMGTRSILQTVQQVLQYATTFLTPIWQAGFLLIALRWAAGEGAVEKDLLSGFKRLGSLFSYHIWVSMLYISILFAATYGATVIVLMTPYGQPLMDLAQVMMTGTAEAIEALPVEQLYSAYAPVLLLTATVSLPFIVFLSYSLRLSTWFIMADNRFRAFSAMRASTMAMRGNRRQLLKLDLSYWWFYLLEFLLTAVAYLDLILPALGVALPVDSTTAFFATLILYGVLNLALNLWAKAGKDTAYALAFQALAAPILNPPPVPREETAQ